MYLIIFEDGKIWQAEKITDEDKMAADSGVIDIINCDLMRQYHEGEWHTIETWNN